MLHLLQILLKGVEQLRVAVNPPAAIDVPMKLAPASKSSSGTSTEPAPRAAAAASASMSLWSNPLGGDSGGVDEVLNAISGVTLSEDPASLSARGKGSLWDGQYDEDAERRAFQAAVQAWRNSGKAEATGSAPSAAAARGAGAADDAYPLPPSDGSGGALLAGEIDEEAEHRAFQEAVRSWRTGASADPDAIKASCYTCFKVFVNVRALGEGWKSGS